MEAKAKYLANEYYLDYIGIRTKDKIREEQLNYDVTKLELDKPKQKIISPPLSLYARANAKWSR